MFETFNIIDDVDEETTSSSSTTRRLKESKLTGIEEETTSSLSGELLIETEMFETTTPPEGAKGVRIREMPGPLAFVLLDGNLQLNSAVILLITNL